MKAKLSWHKSAAWMAVLWLILPTSTWGQQTGQPVAIEALTRFIAHSPSCSMHFVQTVTAAATNATTSSRPVRSVQSEGTFLFVRPGRFRFDYVLPQQTWVADGKKLWVYDADLAQVTVRSQKKALQGTPVAVIATATSLEELQRSFLIQPVVAPPAPVLASGTSAWVWVALVPKAADSASQVVQQMYLAFEKNPPAKGAAALRAFWVRDAFGQISQLQFSGMDCHTPLPRTQFVFTPPKGVEVVALP